MMMNYIIQLNTFENLCTGMLPIKSQIIYYKLFKWSNKFGLGEPFQLSNDILMLDTGITDRKSFIAHRNLLKQRGFIEFTPGKKGSPSTYVLTDLTKFGVNTQLNTELNMELNMELNSPPKTELNMELNMDNLPIKEKYKNKNKTKNKRANRHKYGQYQNVLLADDEIEKLKVEFPDDWQERIENVSSYCQSHGKTYNDYLATIRAWARKDNRPKIVPIKKNDVQSGLAQALEILGVQDG